MTAEELADDGKALLDERASPCSTLSAATDTNAFFVTQEYSEANGVTKLSDLEGKSASSSRPPPTARAGSTARAG